MTSPQISLRRVARIVNGGTPSSDDSNWAGDVAWATPVDLARAGMYINSTDRPLTQDGLASGSRAVPAGSVILSTRAPIGSVAICGVRMAFNQGCRGLVPLGDNDPRFLAYQLIIRTDELQAAGQGSTFKELTSDALAALRLTLPEPAEQRRIADWLDQRIGDLDRTAEAHSRLLVLLDERVESLIGARIAAALDEPSSGMLPMKRLLQKVVRPADPGAEVVTAFRDGQVIARALRRAEGYTESASDDSVMQGVLSGDVVVHGLDGFAGAVGTSESDGRCSPANHVCVPLGHGDPDYYGRLLRTLAVTGYLSLYGGSARERAVDFRNWGSFSRIPLPNLTVLQQVEIGAMIRAARPLRSQVDQLRALLTEKKYALIAAALHGHTDAATRSVA